MVPSKHFGNLVFTQHLDDRVIIGDPANPIGIVQVVRISRGHVRIRFMFPKSVPVNREEVTKGQSCPTE